MAGEMILNQMNRMYDAPNPLEMFMSGQQSAQALDAQRMKNLITQNQINQLPIMNNYDAARLQQVEQQMNTQRLQDEQMQMETRNAQISTAAREALAMPESRRLPFLVDFANKLDPSGEKSKALLAMQDEDPASVTAALQQWASLGTGGGPTAEQKTRASLLADIKPFLDANGRFMAGKADAKALSAAAELGIVARQGTLSAPERTAVTPGMTEAVAGSQAAIGAAEEGAKLDVQLEKKPELERRITEAREKVIAEVEKINSQRGQLGRFSDAQQVVNALMPKGVDDLSRLTKIYGRGESVYPKLLRSQDGINAMAERDQLVSMLQLGARGELKGQGPITESEQAILSKAVTILSEPDIDPKLAAKYIGQAMTILGRNAGIQGTSTQPKSNTFTTSSGINVVVE